MARLASSLFQRSILESLFLAGLLCLQWQDAMADESLQVAPVQDSAEGVPYVLNIKGDAPKYLLILFPGGTGQVNPKMNNGKLVYKAKTNFLLRVRPLWVDDEFATVSTNSTQSKERIQALLDDLKQKFPAAKIYLIGTSNGTYDTLELAEYLSDRIAGEIHTSSLQRISAFDAHNFRNRQLLVHHREDGCKSTPFAAAQAAHDKYGDELIVMEGGVSKGDECQPFAYHGFNGIEKETVDAIKQWIQRG